MLNSINFCCFLPLWFETLVSISRRSAGVSVSTDLDNGPSLRSAEESDDWGKKEVKERKL